jgi:hypothetical protein
MKLSHRQHRWRLLRAAAIPDSWLDALDGREIVAHVAADAATEVLNPPWHRDAVPQEWWDRYPGW